MQFAGLVSCIPSCIHRPRIMVASLVPPIGLAVTAALLTPSSFAPFGTVIQNPHAAAASATVNQGTASKHLQISPFTSSYAADAPSKTPAAANINLFVCRPRQLLSDNVFSCRILERHPYTSQTFIPIGLVADDETTAYLVIVAPTDKTQEGRPPVLGELKAFLCRGNQAVTYAAGTWHAPMIVLGKREVEFVVLVHENGISGEDTQEVEITDEGIPVKVPAIKIVAEDLLSEGGLGG